MIGLKAEYKVREGEVDKVIDIVKDFISRAEEETGTLLYEAFQYDDDKTKFVHFMLFKDKESEEFHKNTEYGKKFADELYPLCEKRPEFSYINYLNDSL